MTNTATGWEPWKRWQVSGNLVKRYPSGITIDDERGVRHFIKTDLIISQPQQPQSRRQFQQGNLW